MHSARAKLITKLSEQVSVVAIPYGAGVVERWSGVDSRKILGWVDRPGTMDSGTAGNTLVYIGFQTRQRWSLRVTLDAAVTTA